MRKFSIQEKIGAGIGAIILGILYFFGQKIGEELLNLTPTITPDIISSVLIIVGIVVVIYGLYTIRMKKQLTSDGAVRSTPASPIPIQSGAVVIPKGGEPLTVTVVGSGLDVYTRAEVEQTFPFESFVSRVKHGGELVIMATAFAVGRYKTDTIKRLITVKNVTVTISLLAPFPEGRRTAEIEFEFDWKNLTSEIQTTLTLLCKLRKELKELRNRLIIRTYDRTPALSMIVIDPNTEDAIMQVGTYLSGTDASARFQIILSKKNRQDIFDKYWDEYLLIRDKHSRIVDYKSIEDEFLS